MNSVVKGTNNYNDVGHFKLGAFMKRSTFSNVFGFIQFEIYTVLNRRQLIPIQVWIGWNSTGRLTLHDKRPQRSLAGNGNITLGWPANTIYSIPLRKFGTKKVVEPTAITHHTPSRSEIAKQLTSDPHLCRTCTNAWNGHTTYCICQIDFWSSILHLV